jgi:hypothetical protein
MEQKQGSLLSPLDQMKRSDPLLQFILEHNIGPVVVLVAVMLYDSFYAVWLPLLQGIFVQLLRDWPGLLRALLTTPLLLTYYAWQPQTIQRLYEAVESRSRGFSDVEANQLSHLIQPFGYRLWSWLGIVFGVYQAVSFYFALSNGPANWQNSSVSIMLLSSLMTFVSFYAVFQVAVRQVIATVAINKFFRMIRIEISPLHPDGAGGLKPLGQYVVTIGLGIGIIGLALGISFLRARMSLEHLEGIFFLNVGLYLTSAPILFLTTLMEAHRLMQKAKSAVLVEIAEQYESFFQKSLAHMKVGAPIEKELSQLDSLRKMFVIAESSPEWPFNLSMLSKFSAAVALPIILPILIDYLRVLLKF